jgi:iron-sulfur cluster assembly protein
MITFTDSARDKIKKLCEIKNYAGIRIGVKTTGCSGLAYVLEYVRTFVDGSDADNVGPSEFPVVVDKKHQVYLKGMTVDYVKQGLNEGFEFKNPNEKDRCGCGESFRV